MVNDIKENTCTI